MLPASSVIGNSYGRDCFGIAAPPNFTAPPRASSQSVPYAAATGFGFSALATPARSVLRSRGAGSSSIIPQATIPQRASAESKTPPPNAIQSACPESRRRGTAREPLRIRSVTSPSGGGAASPVADASASGAGCSGTDAGCRAVSAGGAASATTARGASVLANSPVTGFFGGGGCGGLGDGRAVARAPGSRLGGLDTSTVGESDASAEAGGAGFACVASRGGQ